MCELPIWAQIFLMPDRCKQQPKTRFSTCKTEVSGAAAGAHPQRWRVNGAAAGSHPQRWRVSVAAVGGHRQRWRVNRGDTSDHPQR